MIVKVLTEHHLEFLSLKEGCRGSSESTHVKMPHCWKSHALALLISGPILKRNSPVRTLRNTSSHLPLLSVLIIHQQKFSLFSLPSENTNKQGMKYLGTLRIKSNKQTVSGPLFSYQSESCYCLSYPTRP